MLILLIDTLGWIGMACILIAFYLNSNNRIDSQSATYQWINAVGSLFLIINTYYYAAYPPMMLNVVWLFIAFLALIKLRVKPKQPT